MNAVSSLAVDLVVFFFECISVIVAVGAVALAVTWKKNELPAGLFSPPLVGSQCHRCNAGDYPGPAAHQRVPVRVYPSCTPIVHYRYAAGNGFPETVQLIFSCPKDLQSMV